MGWWRLVHFWVVEWVKIRFGVGDLATACVSPVEVFGGSVLASLGRTWVRGGSMLFLIRVLIFAFVF